MYTRETILTFGKHKGLKVKTVLRDDPGYILWMAENIKDVQFESGIVEEAEDNDWIEGEDEGNYRPY